MNNHQYKRSEKNWNSGQVDALDIAEHLLFFLGEGWTIRPDAHFSDDPDPHHIYENLEHDVYGGICVQTNVKKGHFLITGTALKRDSYAWGYRLLSTDYNAGFADTTPPDRVVKRIQREILPHTALLQEEGKVQLKQYNEWKRKMSEIMYSLESIFPEFKRTGKPEDHTFDFKTEPGGINYQVRVYEDTIILDLHHYSLPMELGKQIGETIKKFYESRK